MKNFDLNSVDGLTRLLSELNNVIDNKINKVKLNNDDISYRSQRPVRQRNAYLS